jgi:ATP-dependent Clp protease ATP-binding subunit ClpA
MIRSILASARHLAGSPSIIAHKAIDLLDEAGFMLNMAEEGETFDVTEDSIAQVVSEIGGIYSHWQARYCGKKGSGEKGSLRNLEQEIQKRIQ